MSINLPMALQLTVLSVTSSLRLCLRLFGVSKIEVAMGTVPYETEVSEI